MNYGRRLIDGITMYRVVIYALLTIAFAALTLSVAGVLAVAPLALVLSFLVITTGALLTHILMVYITQAASNIESSLITALILFLIVTPVQELHSLFVVMGLGAAAVGLKYVVRYRYRHIFNPVALVLVLASFFSYYGAEWWVGSRYLFPVVLLAALVVVAKTRRWELFLTYIISSSIFVVIAFWGTTLIMSETLIRHFISWPTIFLAAFMLTEPLSLPGTKRLQYVYALIVAALSSIPFSIGSLYGTPELALLAANFMTFVIERPERLRLTFKNKREVGKDTVEYIFATESVQQHKPGQYLEWTLPHSKPDKRGIRRYFTITSAPGRSEVSLAVRHSVKPSTWKQTLSSLSPGAFLYATQRAGDFTLRPNAKHHVWIAGGIGVTPFVSMLRQAEAIQQPIQATLFYCNKTEADIAFKELCDRADAVGVTVIHILQKPDAPLSIHEVGYITADMVKKYVPEWQHATFYISGPPSLVGAYKKLVRKMGVSARRIVIDYFPGLA
ncbi:MAG: hypothetical protein AUK16_01770 [Parcubacteria group bacterium CG2_30_44_11]|nr:MAG: hypothetical protein AUK16_01770 [Parcubacteria group bacterium CG2_30_44_11]